MEDYKLCYVSGCFAYFTTQELDKQWGDDWNDAPYEHNAGTPYRSEDGEWNIIKIAYDGPLVEPCATSGAYSVESINAGRTPWLKSDEWWTDKDISIPAGASIHEFISGVEESGGNVYISKKLYSMFASGDINGS